MQHHDAILPLQLKTLKLATFVMNWQKAAETAQQARLSHKNFTFFNIFNRSGVESA